MIETTDCYTYLGIIFYKSGDFGIALDHLEKQASKAVRAHRRTFSNESVIVNAITQLFDSLVLPILTFGSDVWYPYTEHLTGDPTDTLFKNSTEGKQPHQNAHIKFCRQTLGVHNRAMRIPVLSKFGQVSYLTEDIWPDHCVMGSRYNI